MADFAVDNAASFFIDQPLAEGLGSRTAVATPERAYTYAELAALVDRAAHGLRRLGIERVSVVGGRTVASALIDAGVIQDIYLTTSPRSGGEPNTPMYAKRLETDQVVRKTGTGEDAGVVFEHRIRRRQT